MIRATLAGFAILALVVGAAAPATGQIYRWTDERGNSYYADGLDNVPQRYRSQAVPVGLRNAPASDSTPVSTPSRSEPGETVIRFTPGRHIIVDARINDSASCKLILDTGAGNTLISPRVLAAAGVSLTGGTMAGRTRGVARDTEIEIQRVAVDSLEVGDAKVGRMIVSVYDMDMPDADGLLGQDFLARFNVSIDPAAGIVKLVPK